MKIKFTSTTKYQLEAGKLKIPVPKWVAMRFYEPR